MNRTWGDQNLDYLSVHFIDQMKAWTLYEPVPELYKKLESGEDKDLETVVNILGNFLRINQPPTITYEWGLRMDSNAAGQIRLKRGVRSHIQIPLFYVGKPYALGAILAHELSHEVIDQKNITCESLNELEMLTDLASIAFGLGKLVLNGVRTDVGFQTGENVTLGYLETELKAYAYLKVNQDHRVPVRLASKNLTENAYKILGPLILNNL